MPNASYQISYSYMYRASPSFCLPRLPLGHMRPMPPRYLGPGAIAAHGANNAHRPYKRSECVDAIFKKDVNKSQIPCGISDSFGVV